MQSYTREFNGKNQFWTPSNLGFTNSLIDNKLANLDEIDTSGLLSKNEANETYLKKKDSNSLLSKNEAENTYMKKSDYSSTNISSTSFSLVNYGSNLSRIDITGISYRGAQSRIEIPIPSNITGNTKIVYLDFSVTISNSAILDILACCLNTLDGSGERDYRLGRIFKGFRATADDKSRAFSISDIFIGNISKLYLHFYFDNFTNKYGNDIVAINTSEIFPTNLNMKIVSF